MHKTYRRGWDQCTLQINNRSIHDINGKEHENIGGRGMGNHRQYSNQRVPDPGKDATRMASGCDPRAGCTRGHPSRVPTTESFLL